MVGFEPTTSCSQSTCATTALHPALPMIGAPANLRASRTEGSINGVNWAPSCACGTPRLTAPRAARAGDAGQRRWLEPTRDDRNLVERHRLDEQPRHNRQRCGHSGVGRPSRQAGPCDCLHESQHYEGRQLDEPQEAVGSGSLRCFSAGRQRRGRARRRCLARIHGRLLVAVERRRHLVRAQLGQRQELLRRQTALARQGLRRRPRYRVERVRRRDRRLDGR